MLRPSDAGGGGVTGVPEVAAAGHRTPWWANLPAFARIVPERGGAPLIGCHASLPREQAPSAFPTAALTFRFHCFTLRQMHFAIRPMRGRPYPGGLGTFGGLSD